jgi:hypothetical protein
MNANIVRRMIVNQSNDLIPYLIIKNDNYTLMALFVVSVLIVYVIQAADQVGERISNVIINLKKEASDLKEQLKKKEAQLNSKDKMIEELELALSLLTNDTNKEAASN